MRYHPLTILYQLYQLIKNTFFLIIFLFVIRGQSEFWLFKYGRVLLAAVILLRTIYIFIEWFTKTYEVRERAFDLKEGIFTKVDRTIPFSKIQNIKRQKNFFHNMFGVTSVTFETAMDGEDDAVVFKVLTEAQADSLISIAEAKEEEAGDIVSSIENQEDKTDYMIHYRSSNRDLLKASFTSMSFLAIIPMISILYENLTPFLPFELVNKSVFQKVADNLWLLFVLIAVSIVLSVLIGIIRTYVKYGMFEIATSASHIFIKRGMMSTSYFSIKKSKVQAVVITQPLLKRILNMAEVKLISTANSNSDDKPQEINSLYPFLPYDEAMKLVVELLPTYELPSNMQRLPKQSLWLKLLMPSWPWIIATIALAYFRPTFLNVEQAWWILSTTLFFFVYINRIMDYMHTQFAISDRQLQFRNGGISTRLLLTKQQKVVEMEIIQTKVQQKLKVASVKTSIRATPLREEWFKDVPVAFAFQLNSWFQAGEKELHRVRKKLERI
ncbi:putative membrane protein [Gracilibacillus ureilyticus]|uniref:Putative membrane protein n=1 Tax=Gracilibacillus ureilyticus TaxID=531814 RepID=A0A1H9R684_9BACI|nr:PH domain-containing protein [Gracilibacillus ureilyticus]SER68190.1 putative membrane protein [Gracilibacillus ureilyticus]